MDGLNEEALQFILSRNTPERIQEFASCYVLVSTLATAIVGIAALEGNEIKRMYVDPAFQRQGIGTQLIKELEIEAHKQNLSLLTIEAQPNAVPFYKSLGYKIINEEYLNRDQAIFHIVNMEKRLQ